MLSIHADTSHVIQLAVGPSFMLAAIGGTLTVLTNRLARVNDRISWFWTSQFRITSFCISEK